MLYEGKAVGGIVVTRREPDHFSEADVEILRNLDGGALPAGRDSPHRLLHVAERREPDSKNHRGLVRFLRLCRPPPRF